jgi:RNase P subunit RPR2
MVTCDKCNTSIKPATSAVTVAGQSLHPTCMSCANCDIAIWGQYYI